MGVRGSPRDCACPRNPWEPGGSEALAPRLLPRPRLARLTRLSPSSLVLLWCRGLLPLHPHPAGAAHRLCTLLEPAMAGQGRGVRLPRLVCRSVPRSASGGNLGVFEAGGHLEQPLPWCRNWTVQGRGREGCVGGQPIPGQLQRIRGERNWGGLGGSSSAVPEEWAVHSQPPPNVK